MKRIQRDIEVLATFRVGKPPEPHRFRVKDRFDNIHILKVGRILNISKQKIPGSEVWLYKCQGLIGKQERIYEIQFIVQKAAWQLVKI